MSQVLNQPLLPFASAKVSTGIRLFFALGLIAFGLNKFLHFMPQPVPPAEGGAFLGALAGAGYIFTIAGIVYLLAGVSFLSNKSFVVFI